MSIRLPNDLIQRRRFFMEPATARQRQYEALRAVFVEGLASAEVARRFGYLPAAFRMLCYDFRRGELPDFFASTRPGPREQPKKSLAREQVVALRKRNYSIYDISKALKQQGMPLSATAVREILAGEGFAPLHAGSTRSARHLLAPPRRPLPMFAASCSARASSPH